MQDKPLPNRTIAIIGCGPRGLWALENLISDLVDFNSLSQVSILLFEKRDELGSSMVYNTHQVDTNWINLTERLIQIRERKSLSFGDISIPKFPSYQDWVAYYNLDTYDEGLDNFPPRSRIGRYLNERLLSLINPLIEADVVMLHKTIVVDMDYLNKDWKIKCLDGKFFVSDEVLLTIGHQSTEDDDQIKKWLDYQKDREELLLFKNPYPLEQFYAYEPKIHNQIIGIRGFGLAMIDLVRGLANRVGSFKLIDPDKRVMKFIPYDSVAIKFIPFSLDGLPMAPKPLNQKIDEQFAPRENEIETFKETITDDQTQSEAASPSFLINAFARIAAQVYSRYNEAFDDIGTSEVESVAQAWLSDSKYNHPKIISKEIDTLQMMEGFVKMALAQRPASLDYFFGQLWRHVQPSIYDALSYNKCSDEVISQIVALDERLKRYAYGPPVESISQLIALNRAGVLSLNWVNNPEIELGDNGWKFEKNEEVIHAELMIDSVLNQPILSKVDSPLVLSLKRKNYISYVNSDLGILTNSEGQVLDEQDRATLPLFVLGRLAKGTIIGVDALMEALGDRPEEWARAAAERQKDFLEKQKLDI